MISHKETDAPRPTRRALSEAVPHGIRRKLGRPENHGLWTTQQIVDTSAGAFKDSALIERRPRSLTANHPTLGTVTIRDQAPLRLQFLEGCLTDMSIQQWLAILNDRVFFSSTPRNWTGCWALGSTGPSNKTCWSSIRRAFWAHTNQTCGYHRSTPVRRCIRTPGPRVQHLHHDSELSLHRSPPHQDRRRGRDRVGSDRRRPRHPRSCDSRRTTPRQGNHKAVYPLGGVVLQRIPA